MSRSDFFPAHVGCDGDCPCVHQLSKFQAAIPALLAVAIAGRERGFFKRQDATQETRLRLESALRKQQASQMLLVLSSAEKTEVTQ